MIMLWVRIQQNDGFSFKAWGILKEFTKVVSKYMYWGWDNGTIQ